MWTKSFIMCLAVWSMKQCFTPAHGHTPHPKPNLPSLYEMKQEYSSGLQVTDKQQVPRKRQVTENTECELVKVKESLSGPHEIKKVREDALTFYLRPKPSFRRVVFKISVKHVVGLWNEFNSDKSVTLRSSNLEGSDSKPWTLIKVKHYRDSLRVTAGNMSLTLATDYSWLHSYKGFVIFVDGGAEVLFNCPPEVLQDQHSKGVWFMAGLMLIAGLLLTVLLGVYLSIKRRRKREASPPLPPYPVYEEFDVEVLNKVRQKVEALRSGKSTDNLNNAGRDANPYVLDARLVMESKVAATTRKDVNSSERPYENVYSLRPTPAPRKTREAQDAQYQNLTSL